MSMSTPFEPEPTENATPEVPSDDLEAGDADAAADETDDDALAAALHAREPQGLRTPTAGDSLSPDELSEDLDG